MNPEGARDVRIGTGGGGAKVSHAELQQDVQRVVTVFMERIAQASEPLVDQEFHPDRKEALLRRLLMYSSSALDIATGPFAELNALDLMVFTVLCRDALVQHWIPQGIGREGHRLVEAFNRTEQEASEVLGKILDARQQAEVRDLIAAWQASHPGQFRVEGVRFSEFSEHAGAASDERARKSRGMLGQLRSATSAADQALLISERAFFVAHRIPFLIRLQARIGVQETLGDSLARLDNVEALMTQVPAMRPLIADLSELTSNAGATAHEARLLLAAAQPLIDRFAPADRGARGAGDVERVSGMTDTLDSAKQLTEHSLELVRELRTAMPDDPERTVAVIEQRVDRNVRRWVGYALLVGFGWAVFFWSGYVVAKRITGSA
jgi:hypothetical protein